MFFEVNEMSTIKKSGIDRTHGIRAMLSIALVLSSAQPSYSKTTTPSLVKKSWGLVGAFGVDAPSAWQSFKGSCSDITVAVIDTGVDFSHPDLKNSQWVNKKELAGKAGVDDDGNGYIDDVHGFDYVEKTGKKIVDEHGHGTHIAGIIAADASGDNGIRGVCPGAKIMSLRYHGPKVTGVQALDFTVKAIHYAIKNGAQIINYSGGGRYYSAEEFAAMKAAESAGVLVVAAAGNETSNVDQEENRYYPASYGLSNIISVGGIDPSGLKVKSSNWGMRSVDIAAPGKEILSTGKGGTYQMLTGTSQATAFASGVAALIMATNKGIAYTKVKEIIVESGQKTPTLAGKVKQSSRLNALAAIEMTRKQAAPAVTKTRTRSKVATKKNQRLARETATWHTFADQKSPEQIHPALNQ